VFYYLDQLSFQNLERIQEFETDSEMIDGEIIPMFRNTILTKESLSPHIRNYLHENQADPDFKSGILIRELKILDFPDEYILFDESEYSGDKITKEEPKELKNALQVNTYFAEGNYYKISFDFYMDFTHKKRIIYQEMAGTMSLSLLTIMIVLFVFIYTMRNMLRQKKLSDMKSDFINNMTHELKTPLTTIAVASSSLADPTIHSREDKVVDISRMIGKQNRHLNLLIDHILDVELWERDQVALTKQPVDISHFLKEKIDAFRTEHQEDQVEIFEEFDLEGVEVELDEFQFTRVMNNLLSNAVKYSMEKPKITVKGELKEKLIIQVIDNGVGIDREAQKNVFSKFYRANQGNIQKVKGLGLGLYYVRKIIEAHDGQVSVISRSGSGSTFMIELPLNPMAKR
jgi:signal transduction histidine kinase